jgi:predicted dehydrogenase
MIGYGGAFNMGLHHSNSINQVEGMQVVAVCDVDKARTAQAEIDLPGIRTYNDVKDLLADDGVDLCVIILPHNLHAEVSIACSKAGKHVVVEKPMCITVKEATAMIDAAKKAGKALTIFHNRRHDGDFKALRDAVQRGLIGKVFHVEMFMGNFGDPGTWWRSKKEISGGAFYDWGAHCLDWLMHIIPEKMDYVTGYFHKLVWDKVSNEDQVEATIRFRNGAVANIQMSSIAAAGKPRWRVLGTEGAIVEAGDHFDWFTFKDGIPVKGRINYADGDWHMYYQNLGDHLLRGKALEVKPEEARRVIAVMECAEKSSKEGKLVKVPYED